MDITIAGMPMVKKILALLDPRKIFRTSTELLLLRRIPRGIGSRPIFSNSLLTCGNIDEMPYRDSSIATITRIS
jgi:hypothetical protein